MGRGARVDSRWVHTPKLASAFLHLWRGSVLACPVFSQAGQGGSLTQKCLGACPEDSLLGFRPNRRQPQKAVAQ